MLTPTLTENPKCSVSLKHDLDTQRSCRLTDRNHAQLIRPAVANPVAGEAKSAGRLRQVLESVRMDTKQGRSSNIPVPVDGAGGCPIE